MRSAMSSAGAAATGSRFSTGTSTSVENCGRGLGPPPWAVRPTGPRPRRGSSHIEAGVDEARAEDNAAHTRAQEATKDARTARFAGARELEARVVDGARTTVRLPPNVRRAAPDLGPERSGGPKEAIR